MYDRTSSTAVFAMATFVYLGFLGDALKVDQSVLVVEVPGDTELPEH